MKKLFLLSLVLASCTVSKPGDKQFLYKVLKSQDNIEIRQYDDYIAAETYVEGNRKNAPVKAFKILSDYILGANKKRAKIMDEMPIVLAERKMNFWSMSFDMPKKYRVDNIPKPDSDKITFKKIKKRKLAAITFYGSWTKDNFSEKTEELLKYLKKNNYRIYSQEINVFHNDQSIIPFFRKNEVMFEIQ